MDFADYWTSARARVDRELTRQIPSLFSTLAPKQIETVQEVIKNGKRIRGCLVCLVNQALGGQITDALPRAVAIECIQAASLIHDDYVDNDLTRRQRPAVWTIEGPRRAVLLGDVIFATAMQSMVELSNEDGITITRAVATLANGAYQEFVWHAQPLENREGAEYGGNIYERTIFLKTGALFGAACQLGAIATGASPEICALAYVFGVRTGEAYQIADDLADFVIPQGRHQERAETLPALLPALRSYCYKTGLAIPDQLGEQRYALHDWCQRIEDDFVRHMEREINQRVRLAELYARQFPGGPYEEILGEAPARIAAMMTPCVV